jgi:chromosome partitioning protein
MRVAYPSHLGVPVHLYWGRPPATINPVPPIAGHTGQDQDRNVLIVDTPPATERLTTAALANANVVVVPTRIGGVEGQRLTTTLELVPSGTPPGWWSAPPAPGPGTSARRSTPGQTRASPSGALSQNGSGSAGPEADLHPDGLEAVTEVWNRVTRAARRH